MKLNDKAIELWNDNIYSMQMIGDRFGVTRQAVKKYLNKRGIKTDKGQAHNKIGCSECGKDIIVMRHMLRKYRNHYCSSTCYYRDLHNPDYQYSRTGMRHARAAVSRVFPLQEGHVVHHKDSNQTNNDLNNLMVFRGNGDHVRWHRLDGAKSGVTPLFGA